MPYQPGDSLNPYAHLDFLEASSAEALLAQLKQIKIDHSILGFYHGDGKHFVWLNLSHPLIKEKRSK